VQNANNFIKVKFKYFQLSIVKMIKNKKNLKHIKFCKKEEINIIINKIQIIYNNMTKMD
jgi:hypothetical protein